MTLLPERTIDATPAPPNHTKHPNPRAATLGNCASSAGC